jgi:hypothetical protein
MLPCNWDKDFAPPELFFQIVDDSHPEPFHHPQLSILLRLAFPVGRTAHGQFPWEMRQTSEGMRLLRCLRSLFVKFRERWSVRQTFQWFRDHDIELPANPIQGTRLVWKIPSQSLVRDILGNPFYAGAYVWGRRPVATLLIEGRLEKRQGAMRRAEHCRVFIRDHHGPVPTRRASNF